MFLGQASIKYKEDVFIQGYGSVVGQKEGEGPLGSLFDEVVTDPNFGGENWEDAESKLQEKIANTAIKNSGLETKDIRYIFAGDLLGQLIATSFGLKNLNIPLFGLYGACSTMGESISLGSMCISGGYAEHVLCMTSSHFASAEKSFRFPLGYGTQRKFSATWTVTGGGGVVLGKAGGTARITGITTGKIVDYGCKDKENMGACMAPAAADTIYTHLQDFETSPEEYDKIITGDLGYIGKQLVIELMAKEGYEMGENFTDCGIEIFDKENQDTHSGGSGCACSAVTFASYFYKKLQEGTIGRMLFLPTGALMSPTTSQQGSTIPGIAHGVVIESRKE